MSLPVVQEMQTTSFNIQLGPLTSLNKQLLWLPSRKRQGYRSYNNNNNNNNNNYYYYYYYLLQLGCYPMAAVILHGVSTVTLM